MPKNTPGKLLAAVGIPRVGKTFLTGLLMEKQKEEGTRLPPICRFQYPHFDGQCGSRISAYMRGESKAPPAHFHHWYIRNRQWVERQIQTMLNQGYLVITEGYWIDTLIGGLLDKVPLRELRELIRGANFLQPDLTVLLDCPGAALPEGLRAHREFSVQEAEKAVKLYRRFGKTLGFNRLEVTIPNGDFQLPTILVKELEERVLNLYA